MTGAIGSHDLAIVISDLSGGGAQRVVTILANHWAVAGHRIAVITFADQSADFFNLDPQVDRYVSGGIGASRSTLGASAANFARIRSLRRTLREANAPTVLAFVGATNILTILAAVGLGIRVIISERNDPARQSLGCIWDALRRIFYRYADLVTANSKSAIASLSEYVPQRKLRLVRNPVMLPDPRPAPSPEPMILNVGRLVPQKAQDVLLEAFARIASEAPDWKLVIVGEGPEEQSLKDRAASLGISDRTTFTGQTDPWPYYARASIFALPSRYEGTPNALLEAMSMGVAPLVSISSPGALEYIRPSQNGIVIPAADAGATAEALLNLIRDPHMRRDLGASAQKAVSGNGASTVATDWESILGLATQQLPA